MTPLMNGRSRLSEGQRQDDNHWSFLGLICAQFLDTTKVDLRSLISQIDHMQPSMRFDCLAGGTDQSECHLGMAERHPNADRFGRAKRIGAIGLALSVGRVFSSVRLAQRPAYRRLASAIAEVKTTCNLPSAGAHGLNCPHQPANLFS